VSRARAGFVRQHPPLSPYLVDRLAQGLVGTTTSSEEALGRILGARYACFAIDHLRPADYVQLASRVRRCIRCWTWAPAKDACYDGEDGPLCPSCATEAAP
jgi:hypothetical protein